MDSEEEAEAIIINTCCFIGDAREESVETILEMAEYKKTGSCCALLVTGCMAQRYQKEITQEIPEVDAVLGTTAYEEIADALEKKLLRENVIIPSRALIIFRRMRKNGSLPPEGILAISRSRRAATSTVPTVLSQAFAGISEAFPWNAFWRRRRIWQSRE